MRLIQVIFILSALCLTVIPRIGNAQTVPEEALRHMVRGQAAVEMAKSPAELKDAIKEFQKAIELAPSWPAPFYNLGLVQEKAGTFREAIASFKRYLQLAPDAPDAAKVQEQIYRLEYKAEQVLSIPEIIGVLVSGFSYRQGGWKYSGGEFGGFKRLKGQCRGEEWGELNFSREGSDTVKVLRAELYYPMRETYQTLKVTGPVLKYTTTINVCDAQANREDGGCDSVIEHEVEVVSKRLIKVSQEVVRGGAGAGVADGDKLSCTYEKE